MPQFADSLDTGDRDLAKTSITQFARHGLVPNQRLQFGQGLVVQGPVQAQLQPQALLTPLPPNLSARSSLLTLPGTTVPITLAPILAATPPPTMQALKQQLVTSFPALVAAPAPVPALTPATATAPALQADYEKQWDLASQEDREKAPVRFVPRNMFYTR